MNNFKSLPSQFMGGGYFVSKCGRVFSKKKKIKKYCVLQGRDVVQVYKAKELKPHELRGGYLAVHLGHNHKKAIVQTGRLVLMAYRGMPQEGSECCHNDGNPKNNSIENLRWDTHFNNNQDRKKHGNYKVMQAHSMSKYPKDLLIGIRSGLVSRQEAKSKGVSNTHFYRVRMDSRYDK